MDTNRVRFFIKNTQDPGSFLPEIQSPSFTTRSKKKSKTYVSTGCALSHLQKGSESSSTKKLRRTQPPLPPALKQSKSQRSPVKSKRKTLTSIHQYLTRARTMTSSFPMTSAMAFTQYSRQFSEYEKNEILNYSEVYYMGNVSSKYRKKDEPNYGFDESDGSYILYKGDHLEYRYEILDILGAGSFGKVCKAHDHQKKEDVAIKIIKNATVFHRQAQVEITLLATLQAWNLDGSKPIVQMRNYFLFRGHICIVFELMHVSLFDKLRLQDFQGLSEDCIKPIAQEILSALMYIRKHGIIHCDLKPENILFASPKEAAIKLIDFGSACFSSEKVHTYVQSRFYRAPEILLGSSYSTAIDMWSLGCILYELYIGKPLFGGSNESEQMGLYLETLGMPPQNVLDKATRKTQFFDETGNPRFEPGKEAAVNCKELLAGGSPTMKDFISLCVQWDPKLRPSPSEALSHPWFK